MAKRQTIKKLTKRDVLKRMAEKSERNVRLFSQASRILDALLLFVIFSLTVVTAILILIASGFIRIVLTWVVVIGLVFLVKILFVFFEGIARVQRKRLLMRLKKR